LKVRVFRVRFEKRNLEGTTISRDRSKSEEVESIVKECQRARTRIEKTINAGGRLFFSFDEA